MPPPSAAQTSNSTAPTIDPGPAPSYQQAEVVLAELPAGWLRAEFVAVLTHPISAEHPTLLHFIPSSSAGPPQTLLAALSTTAFPMALVLVFGASALLLAAMLATARGRQLLAVRLRRRRPLFAAGLTLSVALLALAGGMLAAGMRPAGSSGGSAQPSFARVVSGQAGAPRSHVLVAASALLTARPSPQAGSWSRLVSIEDSIVRDQQNLARAERSVRVETVSAGRGAHASELATLQHTLAQHHAEEQAFSNDLEAEFNFYRDTVVDPAARTRLLTAAASQPAAYSVVQYDLVIVQTVVVQEAAISEAAATARAQQAAFTNPQPMFVAPLRGTETLPFGPTTFALEPPLTYGGVFYRHFHTGIDIAGPYGVPVGAAAPGVVVLAAASLDSLGHLVGYGNYVVIANADGFETLYAHLAAIAVQTGETVEQGQVIGWEGATGWATGPHVHFEIRRDGTFLDPAPYLAGSSH